MDKITYPLAEHNPQQRISLRKPIFSAIGLTKGSERTLPIWKRLVNDERTVLLVPRLSINGFRKIEMQLKASPNWYNITIPHPNVTHHA